MSGTVATPMPIVELKPSEDDEAPDMSRDLKRRIRQQEILAELGVKALQGASFDQLMGDTARLTAEGMQAEFCKVLEHNPAEDRFLDPVLTRHLADAAYRVSAVAKAHERIHQGDGTDRLDLGIYIEQVCRDLNEVVGAA